MRTLVLAVVYLVVGGGLVHALEARLEVQTDARFDRPHDIVLSPDGTRLYVADLGHDAVQVLDATTLRTVGTIGADTLSSPHDVTFDGNGRLLVADSGNDRVAIFALEGETARLVGELKDGLGSPEGVAVDRSGRVYVTSAGRHTLTVFEGTRVVRRIGQRGSGALEFIRPHDVDLDAEGLIYVVDAGNHRIQVLNPQLEWLRTIGGAGFDFNEPKYLAFDAEGRLYVADEYNSAVKVFAAGGQRLLVITQVGDSPLNQPEGVIVRGDGLWVSDTYNNRTLRFRLQP